MTIFFIIIPVVIVFLIIGIITDIIDYDGSIFRIIGAVMSIATLIVFFIYLFPDNKYPSALDVYRGNTELRIKQEVINNEVVSMDTIVIWKQ